MLPEVRTVLGWCVGRRTRRMPTGGWVSRSATGSVRWAAGGRSGEGV